MLYDIIIPRGLSSKKFKSKNLKLKRGQESFETAICGGSHGELVAIKRKKVLGIFRLKIFASLLQSLSRNSSPIKTKIILIKC